MLDKKGLQRSDEVLSRELSCRPALGVFQRDESLLEVLR
jgi:hypothetical protein